MTPHKTILITGASSGIGRALAELYASSGVTLLLTGRDAARMEEAAVACREKGAQVDITLVDVTDREAFEKQVLAWDDAHPINLVIANAGISGGMGKNNVEAEALFREVLRVNLDGTFNTVNPLIPRMQARKQGQIALMSSIAGLKRGLPSAVAYSVAKNAVRAYGEALRPLLKPDGISVNVICPGFIKTPLTAVNRFPMPFIIDTQTAAAKIKQGLERDKPVIAFPWQMRVFMEIAGALPRALSDAIFAQAPRKG